MNLDKVIAVRNTKTIYRDGDKCIKLFNEDYSKADVLNEALNQARVEETGLNIPKIIEVTTVDGKWAIVSEFIKGKTLSQLMKENPAEKERYLNEFVDLQLLVQSKTCPMLNKLKDKMNRKIAEAEIDATTRYDLHTRLEGMPKHNKLCHGDFWMSNIIIAEDNTPYILDWSHATQGRCENLPVVLAQRRYRRCKEVPRFVLQKERHRKTVRSEMDANCRCIAVR